MNTLRRLLRGSTDSNHVSKSSVISMSTCNESEDATNNNGDDNEEEEFEQLIVTPSPHSQSQSPKSVEMVTMTTKTATELQLQEEEEEVVVVDADDDEDDNEDYTKVLVDKKHKRRNLELKRGQRRQRERGDEDYSFAHDIEKDYARNKTQNYHDKYGYDNDDDDEREYKYTQRRLLALAIICATALISILCFSIFNRHAFHRHGRHYWNNPSNKIPDALVSNSEKKVKTGHAGGNESESGVYSLSDFRNDMGLAVPYWKDLLAAYNLPYSDDGNYDGEYYDDDKFFNDEIYGLSKSNSTSKSKSTLLRKNNTTLGNNDVDEDGDEETNGIVPHLGPCYLPHTAEEMNHIPWSMLIEKNYNKSHIERNIHYPAPYVPYNQYMKDQKKQKKKYGESSSRMSSSSMSLQQSSDLAGYCRPGFIIIGAGKCGTSSLYQYLVGHNRVAPAKKKQIHYFKYYPRRPMSWYLSFFYGMEDFLSSGSLITGEASPGYLPYPDVAHRILSYMKNKANNGNDQAIVPTPKIITIVRNPLERSYSSYNYNYVEPTLEEIKKDVAKAKRKFRHRTSNRDTSTLNHHSKPKSKTSVMVNNILSKNMTDDEIVDEYLFSFEQLVVAEMKVLKECLKKGGAGEQGAKALYGSKAWAVPLFEKRENQQQEYPNGVPSLVTMDDSCYGDTVSSLVPRVQWSELVKRYPHKIINVKNLHLVQSLVGRSLYSLPLEWWYELYPSDDLYLVCNEELKYKTSKTMSDVSDFLGLPTFDFGPVVSKGMYNVGGNNGYDKVTEWKEAGGATGLSTPINHKKSGDGIPISDELRSQYLSFVKPYNERLFELAKKRCDW